MGEKDDATFALRQKLMTADEVYVYKIPPLKNAGGHRAEDWNLSKPLKTCHLLVERRGDALVLEFTSTDNGAVFCQSIIDLSQNTNNTANTTPLKVEQWLEQVVDSSRYFVLKIQGQGNREAHVGFGFRDRDQATDLREGIQHYEKSMRRETEAADPQHNKLGNYSIPKMKEGETIHVNRTGSGTKSTITKEGKVKGSGVPLLKKKPPSSPVTVEEKPKVDAVEVTKATAVGKLSINFGDINLDAEARASGGLGTGGGDDSDEGDGDSSGGAVFTGDEELWATEFDMK